MISAYLRKGGGGGMFMFRCVAGESVEPLHLWEKSSQSSGKWLTSVVVVFLSSGPLHINSRPLQAYRVFFFSCPWIIYFLICPVYLAAFGWQIFTFKKVYMFALTYIFISYNEIHKAKLNLKRLFFFFFINFMKGMLLGEWEMFVHTDTVSTLSNIPFCQTPSNLRHLTH